MKLTKKKVFVTALALCLVAILSVGTLAWFQAADQVDNYFQVTTDEEGRPDFKLDLFEHEFDGEKLTDVEVEENTYKHIAPGDVLPKDPTIRNSGSYDQWVRVKVTLVYFEEWEKALGDGIEFNKFFEGFNDEWILDESTKGTDTLVFYYKNVLKAGEKTPLFEGFKISEEFTVDNMPTKFKLTIVGEAIQADNTGDNAKAAFDTYWS